MRLLFPPRGVFWGPLGPLSKGVLFVLFPRRRVEAALPFPGVGGTLREKQVECLLINVCLAGVTSGRPGRTICFFRHGVGGRV